MRRFILTILLLGACVGARTQTIDLRTFYEKSGGKRTPRYQETVEYCRLLDSASKQVKYLQFGRSPQGRELPLLIVDKMGFTRPEDVKASGRLVLMVQACIHPGESDGKDAGFLLIRDIITKKAMAGLLDHVSILFIPILNVDGHERFGPYNRFNQNGPEEMGWRTTAQNLNLNRDFMKADAPEMQAWLQLWNAWSPDFFVDCHVTDGADYQYVLTYAMETKGSMEQNLTRWTSEVCEPFLLSSMEKAGMPMFPYVQFRRWHDPRSGLVDGVAPPMLSQGYTAVRNRPGLLIESHMLKPYQPRVEANYELIRLVLELLNKERNTLLSLNRQADDFTASAAFRKEPLILNWVESFTDSTMQDFRGFEYSIDTSDLSGGLWFRYDDTKPVTWKLPMFRNPKPDKKVMLPEAYVIPAEWTDIIDRMRLHGIRLNLLDKETRIPVKITRFSNVRWQNRSYEGRIKLNYSLSDSVQDAVFPAGSVLIEMNQPAAKVIAHLLEPSSPDSYAAWGFFNAVMEQKEYFESYRMEQVAREMLKENPSLAIELKARMDADPKFASDPYAILGWFYARSPWMDSRFNVYPVGRIVDADVLEKLR